MKKLTSAQDAIKQAIEGGYDFEKLAARLHEIYQAEARRQGDVRHKDSYEKLTENVKNFDRVLANEMAYLEPLFWQALGKARGWKGDFYWLVMAKQWFEIRLWSGDEAKFWQSLP